MHSSMLIIQKSITGSKSRSAPKRLWSRQQSLWQNLVSDRECNKAVIFNTSHVRAGGEDAEVPASGARGSAENQEALVNGDREADAFPSSWPPRGVTLNVCVAASETLQASCSAHLVLSYWESVINVFSSICLIANLSQQQQPFWKPIWKACPCYAKAPTCTSK